MKYFIFAFIVTLLGCGRPDTELPYLIAEIGPNKIYPVECRVYDLSSYGFSVIPDYSTISSIGSVGLDRIDNANSIDSEIFTSFVNTPFENKRIKFGVQCQARLLIDISGTYTFKLTSDDGSRLFIDGTKLIDHDGLHSFTSKTASMVLTPKVYAVKVEYFNNIGPKGLVLSWIRPNFTETVLEF